MLVEEPDNAAKDEPIPRNIPSPKWIRPADRLKRRVRRSNRKKLYSKNDEYRKKTKRKATKTLLKKKKTPAVIGIPKTIDDTESDIPEVIEIIDETDIEIPDAEITGDDYIPPRERRERNLKRLRAQKERYRKNAVKKTIRFLNKKNAAELLREPKIKKSKP